MILKKPYAILIKHFKKLNFVIFFTSILLLYNTLGFTGFVRDYISLGIYNPAIQSVKTYVSIMFYMGVFISILFSLFLGVLLYYKKRPVFLYMLTIFVNVFTFIIFLFSANYFKSIGFDLINLKRTYLVRDLLNITLFMQILLPIPLFIRSIGLDLKKFGFSEDEDFLEITNEDEEEFEVSVEFDKDKIFTIIKTRIRHFTYFYKENKRILIITTSVFLFIVSIMLYRNFFIINKVYKEKELFKSNIYEFSINNTYHTNKDYKDNVIDDGSREYIIINFQVENKSGNSVVMDTNKFMLINKNETVVPSYRLQDKFSDLGEFYKEQTLKSRQRSTYNLLFELSEEFTDSSYALYYLEDAGRNKTKLRKIKLKPQDITEHKLVDTKKLGESLDIILPDLSTGLFTLVDYEFTDATRYYFEECRGNNCSTVSRRINSNLFAGDNTILVATFDSVKFNNEKLNDIFSKYGKIIYDRENKEVESLIVKGVSSNYRGKTIYLIVPSDVKKSKSVKIRLTLRTKTYEYILKEK